MNVVTSASHIQKHYHNKLANTITSIKIAKEHEKCIVEKNKKNLLEADKSQFRNGNTPWSRENFERQSILENELKADTLYPNNNSLSNIKEEVDLFRTGQLYANSSCSKSEENCSEMKLFSTTQNSLLPLTPFASVSQQSSSLNLINEHVCNAVSDHSETRIQKRRQQNKFRMRQLRTDPSFRDHEKERDKLRMRKKREYLPFRIRERERDRMRQKFARQKQQQSDKDHENYFRHLVQNIQTQTLLDKLNSPSQSPFSFTENEETITSPCTISEKPSDLRVQDVFFNEVPTSAVNLSYENIKVFQMKAESLIKNGFMHVNKSNDVAEKTNVISSSHIQKQDPNRLVAIKIEKEYDRSIMEENNETNTSQFLENRLIDVSQTYSFFTPEASFAQTSCSVSVNKDNPVQISIKKETAEEKTYPSFFMKREEEKEKAKHRMRQKRADPLFRDIERQKDRSRRKIARQNSEKRQQERERDRYYKQIARGMKLQGLSGESHMSSAFILETNSFQNSI